MSFESLVATIIVSVATGAALYTINPAVDAAAHRLVVINAMTDQAHLDAAQALCQHLDNQTNCATPPAGYLDTEKKRQAIEEAAILGQPLPQEQKD